MRHAVKIKLSTEERDQLELLAIPLGDDDRISLRARIVLAAASGMKNKDIATDLETQTRTVTRWRNRFATHRIQGIRTVTGMLGRKPRSRDLHTPRILEVTRNEMPPRGRRWTCRGLAAHLNVSVSLVQRVWRLAGIDSKWRRDQVTESPFAGDEVLKLLGYFVCGNQRAILVEVQDQRHRQKSLAEKKFLTTLRPLIVAPLPLVPKTTIKKGSEEKANGERARLTAGLARQLSVEQQLQFLHEAIARASHDTDIRLITDGAHSFSAPRIKRWIKKNTRISVHFTTATQQYLLNLEADYRSLVDQRIAQPLAMSLMSLAKPETTVPVSILNDAFALTSPVASISAFSKFVSE